MGGLDDGAVASPKINIAAHGQRTVSNLHLGGTEDHIGGDQRVDRQRWTAAQNLARKTTVRAGYDRAAQACLDPGCLQRLDLQVAADTEGDAVNVGRDRTAHIVAYHDATDRSTGPHRTGDRAHGNIGLDGSFIAGTDGHGATGCHDSAAAARTLDQISFGVAPHPIAGQYRSGAQCQSTQGRAGVCAADDQGLQLDRVERSHRHGARGGDVRSAHKGQGL